MDQYLKKTESIMRSIFLIRLIIGGTQNYPAKKTEY